MRRSDQTCGTRVVTMHMCYSQGAEGVILPEHVMVRRHEPSGPQTALQSVLNLLRTNRWCGLGSHGIHTPYIGAKFASVGHPRHCWPL